MSCDLTFAGEQMELHPAGIVWFPSLRLLCVSDIHFEKGSFFSRFGTLLPPYDTHATLLRLAEVMKALQPKIVVTLGDSFHDVKAFARMREEDRDLLHSLIASVEQWIWVEGNHDPVISPELDGIICEEYRVGEIVFRHQTESRDEWEISGHYHPKAKVSLKGHSLSGPCFVLSGKQLILPAFGQYTGGLYITHPQFTEILTQQHYTFYLLYRDQIYHWQNSKC